MAASGHVTLWAFSVQPDRKAEFEFHYGPEGTWVRLFRRAPGYLGSELLRDRGDAHRYREFEVLTTAESPLGEYTPAGVAP